MVGAGAAGVELAFALDARLRKQGRTPHVSLVTQSDSPLSEAAPRLARLEEKVAQKRGIRILGAHRVEAVECDGVRTNKGEIAADLVVWASGAAPLPVATRSKLPRDERGFIRVRNTLQVVGHDELFAVGDCAVFEEDP